MHLNLCLAFAYSHTELRTDHNSTQRLALDEIVLATIISFEDASGRFLRSENAEDS